MILLGRSSVRVYNGGKMSQWEDVSLSQMKAIEHIGA